MENALRRAIYWGIVALLVVLIASTFIHRHSYDGSISIRGYPYAVAICEAKEQEELSESDATIWHITREKGGVVYFVRVDHEQDKEIERLRELTKERCQ